MKYSKSSIIMILLLLLVVSLALDPALYKFDEPMNTTGVCGNIDCTDIGNIMVGNVDCSVYCNVINAPIYLQSPTSNISSTGDVSYNSLIKYDSNNFNVVYHEDISLNGKLTDIGGSPIYYKPGAFKHGSTSYVPSYTESVLLSQASSRRN